MHLLLMLITTAVLLQTVLSSNNSKHTRDVSMLDSNNIKDSILDKINEFSTEDGNKIELLEKIESIKSGGENDLTTTLPTTSSSAATVQQLSLLSSSSLLPSLLQLPNDPILNSNLLTQNPLSTIMENFTNSLIITEKTLPLNIHVQSKQLTENNNDNINDVRDWRIKFYKAFRDAKKNKVTGKNSSLQISRGSSEAYSNVDWNDKKNILLFEKTPNTGNNDDWTRFLSVKAGSLQSTNTLQNQPFSLESTGYQLNNSYTSNSPPSTHAPQFYYRSYQQMNTPDLVSAIIEVPTYRKLEKTSDYQNGPQTTSITTNPDYRTDISYSVQPNAEYPSPSTYYRNAIQQQQIPFIQLLTEYNKTFLDATTPISPTVYPTTPLIKNNDEFTVFDGDNYDQQPSVYAASKYAETFEPDERCNSYNLRNIMISNMVENDSESSKRAIQEAAEQAFGNYYNVICGTGFFSYIAHTDEYCLVSTLGINCYIFSPVCNKQMTSSFLNVKLRGTKNTSNKKY